MSVTVFDDLEQMSRAVAERFVAVSREAIAERGRFLVAFAGGSTPKRAYQLLAAEFRDQVEWSRVHVYWGDERYVPPDDPASNERMAREALLSHVSVPETQVFPMYRPGGHAQAALAYEELLRSVGPEFDLVLAGMGADGHTLSLFPGTLGSLDANRLCVPTVAPVGAAERITLTPKAVSNAHTFLFLVGGAEKAQTLKDVLEGPEAPDLHPSQFVWRSTPSAEWWVDKQAASLLTR